MATAASTVVWDFDGLHAISARQVQLVRDAGALAQLPIYLTQLGIVEPVDGRLRGCRRAHRGDRKRGGGDREPHRALHLAEAPGLQGREAEASAAIASAIEQAAAEGQGMAAAWAHWAAAVLYNGLARYEEAASAARQATSNTLNPWMSMWALPELVEAAARTGDAELARDALERLAETTQPCGTDCRARHRGALPGAAEHGAAADDLYREAIDRLGRTRLRPELARAHLLYGEWLRREDRRVDAREQLRTAHDMFAAIGMEAFAERARRELVATGENGAQAQRRDRHHADPAGGPDRPAGPRRPDQPGDRRPAVPVRAHGRMAPAQDVHQARHQLPPRTARRAGAAWTDGQPA